MRHSQQLQPSTVHLQHSAFAKLEGSAIRIIATARFIRRFAASCRSSSEGHEPLQSCQGLIESHRSVPKARGLRGRFLPARLAKRAVELHTPLRRVGVFPACSAPRQPSSAAACDDRRMQAICPETARRGVEISPDDR